MGNKLTYKALAKFESKRDVWQEILDGVKEINAGKGKQNNVEAKYYVVRVGCTTHLYSDPYVSRLRCFALDET
jgi:hypothetical protein